VNDELVAALRQAVFNRLAGAALLDRDGTLVARAGSIDNATLRHVGYLLARTGPRALAPDLADRLVRGQLVELTVDDSPVFVSIAAMCLFVVAVPRAPEPYTDALRLHRAIDEIITDMLSRAATNHAAPPGTPSGPANLPASELWVTPGIRRGKA
jgi:hypothetical protein